MKTIDSFTQRLDHYYFPVFYPENGSVLCICPYFVCEKNLENNQYYPTILLPNTLPRKILNGFIAALDVYQNRLFVVDQHECRIYQLLNDKISKRLKSIVFITSINIQIKHNYGAILRQSNIGLVAGDKGIHMILGEHHLKFNEETKQFETVSDLPVFSPKMVYLEPLASVIFLGGRDIITDEYQDSIYICKIEKNGSMKAMASEMRLPHKVKNDDFTAIVINEHMILLCYIVQRWVGYKNLELWIIDLQYGLNVRLYDASCCSYEGGTIAWCKKNCYSVTVDKDIHFMNGKKSGDQGYWVSPTTNMYRRFHGTLSIDEILLKSVKLEYKYKYEMLVMGHSKYVKKQYKLFQNIPDYLTKIILKYFLTLY